MKSLQTLKLGATVGAGAGQQHRPAAAADVAPAPAPTAPVSHHATSGAKRMLGLLAIGGAATLASVESTGSIHSTILRIAAIGASLSVATGVLAVLAASFGAKKSAAEGATHHSRARTLSKTKVALLLMMALGFATYFGGGGSFGTFSAETANPNDTVASGTLTMSNTVNGGTACLSYNGASNNNVNAGCSTALSLSNVAPGVFGGTAQIAVQNTGSLSASKLYLWAPYVNGNLSIQINSGATISTLALSAPGLEGPVTSGDSLLLSYGATSQVVTAGASAAAGATSVTISGSPVANATYKIGTTVQDTSSDTSVDNTDCYDTVTTNSNVPVAGATYGSELPFVVTTHNPFCNTALLYVQQIGTNSNYCWYGSGAASATGMCDAPIAANLSAGATINSSTTSIAVAAIRGNVKSGDTVVITQVGAPTLTTTCTASANTYITATAIPVNSSSCSPANTFTTAAVVTDTTTLSTLNADSTDTIKNFDTAHSQTNKVELKPVTANGTVNATPSVELPHFDSGATDTRTFYVGVYFPAPNGSNQNALQGLQSTFGLTWHIDQ